MTHRLFGEAFGHLNPLPAILATAENIPRDHELTCKVVALTHERVGINSVGRASLQCDIRYECAVSDAESFLSGVFVGFGSEKSGIMPKCDGECGFLVRGKTSQRAREAKVDGFKANDLAIFGARIVKAELEFR